MRPLPLVAPEGCSLTAEGLHDQLSRAQRLVPATVRVSRSRSGLSVAFGAEVDHGLVQELVAVEQECCSFLDLDYAADERLLQIGSDDPRGVEVIDRLEEVFAAR